MVYQLEWIRDREYFSDKYLKYVNKHQISLFFSELSLNFFTLWNKINISARMCVRTKGVIS